MLFFTILTIKTEMSYMITNFKSSENNVHIILQDRLKMVYHNSIDMFKNKLNPPIVIVISYVQLVGKLLLYVVENCNENNINQRFHNILNVLWNGDDNNELPGLKYFVTYDVSSNGRTLLVDDAVKTGKMYVSVIDDIVKSRDMLLTGDPTILLHKLVNGGQYLIDQAVKESKSRIASYVTTLIPKDVSKHILTIMLREMKNICNDYKQLEDTNVTLDEKITYINTFILEKKSKFHFFLMRKVD